MYWFKIFDRIIYQINSKTPKKPNIFSKRVTLQKSPKEYRNGNNLMRKKGRKTHLHNDNTSYAFNNNIIYTTIQWMVQRENSDCNYFYTFIHECGCLYVLYVVVYV